MQRRNRRTAATITGMILAVVLFWDCVATLYSIPSSGMENSLYRDEHILVNKQSHGLWPPFMGLWGYHHWAERPIHKEDILVFNNPVNLLQTTIDRKEVFISHCLGVPEDMLLVDSLFSIILSEKSAPGQKFLCAYPQKRGKQLDSLFTILSIRSNTLLGQDTVNNAYSLSRHEYYSSEQALGNSNQIKPTDKEDSVKVLEPLIIPDKGKAVRVYPWSMMSLRNTLILHEKERVEIKNDMLYMEGKPTQCRCFTKDYYWAEANNPINLSSSRLFGLVPEDHATGKVTVIWFPKKQGTGLFGGYHWNRMWKEVK